MKALSFSQPWLWSILYRGKRIENRSWAPPIDMIGQRIVLHAAKSWDKDAVGFMIGLGIPGPIPARQDITKSALVGIATIDRVVTSPKTLADDQKRWFFGEFGWVLTEVQLFQCAMPATGKLGLWTLSDDQELFVNLQEKGGFRPAWGDA